MDASGYGFCVQRLSIQLFRLLSLVSLSSFSPFVLCIVVLWASDLHPLIQELPLPKSCLSPWKIFPTSCVSIFFSFALSPPPASTSPFLSHTLCSNSSFDTLLYFLFSFYSHYFLLPRSSCPSAFGVVWFPFLISVFSRPVFMLLVFLSVSLALSLSTSFFKVSVNWVRMWVCLCVSACLLLSLYLWDLSSHSANTERLQGL